MKTHENEKVLKVLAIALPNETPDHRIRYLLEKLNSFGFGLDKSNTEFFERIKKISESRT